MSVTNPWPGGRYPRVLHVIASLEVGGTEMQLVRFIERSGAPSRHVVAVFHDSGPLAERLPNPPVWLGALSRRPSRVFTNLRTAGRFREVVRAGGFDLVHAHLGLSELLTAATPRSVPVVASRRGPNLGFSTNSAYKLLEGLGHRRTDVLISNTRYWAEAAMRDDRWTPPTRVIHNAIDPEEFPTVPMPAGSVPRVAVIANHHPYKRIDLFLRAFRVLGESAPEARATLAGDGVERQRLERLAQELGLQERVIFAGEVPDSRPVVASSHVVALTSDVEGFPNALLEAMAQGRPVVATRVGGVPELVRHDEDGFLTGRDPSEIASRLLALLSDLSLRDRMARSASERARGFTWARAVRETEDVYRDVLSRRRR
jgi:glycosyltransferase involved in cell wall biosynthesis